MAIVRPSGWGVPAFTAMIKELVKLRTFAGKEFWPIGTLGFTTST